MIQKKYTSFDEIDKDLKILKLKKEIAIWTAKNDALQLKNDLSPRNLKNNLLNGFSGSPHTSNLAKLLGSLVVGYLVKRIIKR